nr:hypothetical protein [Maliibacterium massiliense]
MQTEREKVLELLANGSINAQEAARLLDCLEEGDAKARDAAHAHREADAQRMQGKKLRIDVKGHTKDEGKINVNVSVPLVLARYADNIIAKCVPESASNEMAKNGIDLRNLNISEIVDTFETIQEDIVNADIDQDDTQMKVRVYVE